MSSLPDGVTDQMIEEQANGLPCEHCNHYFCDHYEKKEIRKDGIACDIKGCGCTEYLDCFGDKL